LENDQAVIRIGLISDTHGLVRPGVLEAFEGVDRILHAGDVGGPDVIATLSSIAPVDAVFGNVDVPGDPMLCQHLSDKVEGLQIHVSHGHEVGSPKPEVLLSRYDADVLVFGHTHRPVIHREGSRLVVNPGAAGPRRFHLEPTVAILTIDNGRAEAELVTLEGS
jgi:putative phosphoesterase